MGGMVSEIDLVRIFHALEAPQTVYTLLTVPQQCDDTDLDVLRLMSSAYSPGEALLSLACCAMMLTTAGVADPALKLSLDMLAADVTDDYGPAFLESLNGEYTDAYDSEEFYMQQDFEGFADLFLLAANTAPEKSMERDVLLTLSDIAAAQVEVLDLLQDETLYEAMNDPHSNVVAFPLGRALQ